MREGLAVAGVICERHHPVAVNMERKEESDMKKHSFWGILMTLVLVIACVDANGATLPYGPDTYSINPFLPCYEYIADGEPYIFGDRLYLFGSHIDSSDGNAAGNYVVWSADASNPVAWTYEGVSYNREQDPYANQHLIEGSNSVFTNFFAPDVIEMEGKYYLILWCWIV